MFSLVYVCVSVFFFCVYDVLLWPPTNKLMATRIVLCGIMGVVLGEFSVMISAKCCQSLEQLNETTQKRILSSESLRKKIFLFYF